MIQSFYCENGNQLRSNLSAAELRKALSSGRGMLWVDFENPTPEEFRTLADVFQFHPLAIEDCANVIHHPKVDDYGEYLFLILHAVSLKEEEEVIRTTEIDIFLGKNYLVTYHVEPLGSVLAIRQQIEKKTDTFLSRGVDFALYQILDRMMERFTPIFEYLDEYVEVLEDEVFAEPSQEVLAEIFRTRKKLVFLRRVLQPQRDTILQLSREELPNIGEKAKIYFRDVYDQIFRAMNLTDNYRELLAAITEIYLFTVSNRINEVVKALTVLATVTLPAVVLSSVYGMNFARLPGSQHPLGFWASLVLMGVVSAVIYAFVRRKGWI